MTMMMMINIISTQPAKNLVVQSQPLKVMPQCCWRNRSENMIQSYTALLSSFPSPTRIGGTWQKIGQQQTQQEILDCDQSNVLLTCIIFFCILPRAFSFLSACIRDPASNWDLFNIILIVTGVEIVNGNCLLEVHNIAWFTERKLEIRYVERGICPIATLYSLAAAYKGVSANRAQLSFMEAEL